MVNFIDVSQDDVAKFAAEHDIKHIALTTVDAGNAALFKVHPEALVTAILYTRGEVKANHAVAAGKLDDAAIAAILKSAASLVADDNGG